MVNVNGKTSKPKQLPWSVPQGSCSGAFYFILYASTIFEEIEDGVNLYGFADDHILSKSFKANDRMSEAEAILDLEDSAIDVKIWMDGVKLGVQLQKCVTQQIEITGDKITRNSVIRYLGGFLDETFSLKHHVQKKCAAAMINFNKIRQIRNYLSKEATETLLLGLVISHIDYANSLLMGVPDMVIKPMQRLQNMCAKLVLGLNKYDSATEALYTLHWLPI